MLISETTIALNILNFVRLKSAEQANELESIQCNGGSYANVWMRNLDHTEASREQTAVDGDEVFEEIGGSDNAR